MFEEAIVGVSVKVCKAGVISAVLVGREMGDGETVGVEAMT